MIFICFLSVPAIATTLEFSNSDSRDNHGDVRSIGIYEDGARMLRFQGECCNQPIDLPTKRDLGSSHCLSPPRTSHTSENPMDLSWYDRMHLSINNIKRKGYFVYVGLITASTLYVMYLISTVPDIDLDAEDETEQKRNKRRTGP